MALVEAAQHSNPVIKIAEYDQTYTFSMMKSEDSGWADADITTNNTLCGSGGTTLQNIWAWSLIKADSDWFSVIAEIKNSEGTQLQISDLCSSADNSKTSATATVSINTDSSSYLVLYPNDSSLFYWNNSGGYWFKIHREKTK